MSDKKIFKKVEIEESTIKWINSSDKVFDLYGVSYDGSQYRRFPVLIAKKISFPLEFLSTNVSGGRIRFKSDSQTVSIRAVQDNCGVLPIMSIACQFGFSLYRDGLFVGTLSPRLDTLLSNSKNDIVPTWESSISGKRSFIFKSSLSTHSDKKMCTYDLLFPLCSTLKTLYIGVDKDSKVEKSEPMLNKKSPIIFYGSSITQGIAASKAGSDYVNLISSKLNVAVQNIGFSGNCFGEKQIANYIGKGKYSLLVMEYDHNGTVEHLRNTHLEFYKEIRKYNSDLPIIMISKPTPKGLDNTFKNEIKERKAIIKETIDFAKKQKDKNVYFIEGDKLFKDDKNQNITVDGIHPTDIGFSNMANGLIPTIKKVLKL